MTPQSVINAAIRKLGQSPANTDVDTDLSADALAALNAMIGVFNLDGLICYAVQEESVTLVGSQVAYTLGTTGSDVVTTRPERIIEAHVDVAGLSYPVRIINAEQYESIVDKTAEAEWPDKVYYQPIIFVSGIANFAGRVYTHPVSNGATATLKLMTGIRINTFSSLSETIYLSPGWEEPLIYNLALRLAPEFPVVPSPDVAQIARDSLAAVKRINITNKTTDPDSELYGLIAGGGRRANIYTDGQ